jgi:hypothetical protein
MLLGSDYTEGVAGIGVVNALEVVSAWPGGLAGLQKFRSWLEGPDERLLAAAAAVDGKQTRGGKRGRGSSSGRGARGSRGRAGRTLGKRAQQSDVSVSVSEQEIDASESESAGEDGEVGVEEGGSRSSRGRGSSRGRSRASARGRSSGGGRNRARAADSAAADTTDNSAAAAAVGKGSDVEIVGEHEAGDGASSQQDATGEETAAQRYFKSSHRGVRRTWHLPASFPSQAVMDAYVKPLVDRNTARFSCGRPDTALLQQFCR